MTEEEDTPDYKIRNSTSGIIPSSVSGEHSPVEKEHIDPENDEKITLNVGGKYRSCDGIKCNHNTWELINS